MKYRNLGSSEIVVSELSMGCMSLKGDQPKPEAVIHAAIDQGINFLDTADLYELGINEEIVGRAIDGKREKIVLATKVGNRWTPGEEGWRWDPSKEYIIKAVEDSLRRLKTDYIDLYQLHGGTIDDPVDDTIAAFELLREQGKIREYGVSSIRPNVIREYARKSNIVSVMMQYSLLDRRPEEACLKLLADANISVITRGSLAKGLLADKPAKDYLSYSVRQVEQLQQVVSALAAEQNVTQSQLAIQYVLQTPTVASAVIGFRTTDQVGELTKGFPENQISATIYQTLQEGIQAKQYDAHR